MASGLSPRRIRDSVSRRLRVRRQAQTEERAYQTLINRVVDSGLIDSAFYDALVPDHPAGASDLAQSWIEQEPPRAPINPLAIPADALPGTPLQRENPSSPPVGGQEPLVSYLRRASDLDFPFFDSAAYLEGNPAAEDHAGRAIGHFVAHASAVDRMPVPSHWVGEAPRWGEWHDAMVSFARDRLPPDSKAHLLDEWDYQRERSLIDAANEVEIPQPVGSPCVSIVMPARNRESVIRNAIASVKAQTFDNWELLVIDDGSTDQTASVVTDLASDSRIRLIQQEWLGAAAARNNGLANATGDYLTFLDSDDEWTPDFLRVCLAALQRDGVQCVYAAVRVENESGVAYRAQEGDFNQILKSNFITMSTLMLDSELLAATGGFDESLKRWIDYDFVIRVFKQTKPRLIPVVGLKHDDRLVRRDRITTTQPSYWENVVRAKYLLDWNELAVQLPARKAGRISVVIPTFFDWRMTVSAVRAVLDNSADHDVEVVIVENSGNRQYSLLTEGLFALHPLIHVVHASAPLNFALGCNLGFAHSSGQFCVFLNNDTNVQPGWLDPLLDAIRDDSVGAVQPLLLYADGTVQTAGTVVPDVGGLPFHFLVDHPSEDARRLGNQHYPIGTAAALLMRAEDVAELHGFDEVFINGWEDVDLCLRALRLRPGGVVVAPDSVVTHFEGKSAGRGIYSGLNRQTFASRWRGRMPEKNAAACFERAGFSVLKWEPGHPVPAGALRSPQPVLSRNPASLATDQGEPRLRWALKIAAHAGPRGDAWGDVFFANDLAAALRALGQEVVIDRRDAHNRSTCGLDDVVVVIRGLDTYSPQPGATNLLWVISHPDDVSVSEIDTYDAAFAASAMWSARMSELARIPVRTLLQATNPARFHVPSNHQKSQAALFVGSSRDQDRPIVRDAITVGLPVEIHGSGWEGRVPEAAVRSYFMDNDELSAAYAQAAVVLCDHWPDMAANGFISNRIFDAVASGATVITDPVPGISDIFGPEVFEYKSASELEAEARACIAQTRESFPGVTASERIRTEHSFTARARTLLDTALCLRA